MWPSEWVGLRYAELGRGPDVYDCLGLFLALHLHRFGRVLPDPRCKMSEAARHRVAETMRPNVVAVPERAVREGDALMFHVRGQLLHVGYALNNNDMLHIEDDVTGSVVECWGRSPWLGHLEGVYRFV